MKLSPSILVLTLFLYSLSLTAQDTLPTQVTSDAVIDRTAEFPKIGLSLSGGGARGLAHVALLQALDSSGLRVDYVTGTSVGAIMGSLYASGYNGNFIDSAVREVHWDEVLSDKVPLRSLGMEEKNMGTAYAFELPYKKGKFTVDRSIMEGQGIWSKFTEFLFPVMGINDFSQLQKGYKCVAADIKTGDEVLLEQGSILDAVRASMAVPAAFSPVTIDSQQLIDGGVTRNMPVQELTDMGAEYLIGIDLNHGEGDLDFDNPFNVLLNIGFYSSNKDFVEQSKLCDYHFSFDLRNFGAGDFDKADEIREIGYKSIDSLVRHFTRIKNDLESKYGPQKPAAPWDGRRESYKIDSISVRGLPTDLENNLRQLVRLETGSHYNYAELKRIVDVVFSTNRLKSLHYNLYQRGEDSYTIEYIAVPKEKITLATGVQYNEFERINIAMKLYMHGVLAHNSRTELGGAIGQNARFTANHIQAFNKSRTLGLRPYFYLENITLQNRNRNFEVNAQYRQRYRDLGLELLNLRNTRSQLVAGWRYEHVGIDPSIFRDFILEGKSAIQSVELKYNYNSLNEKRTPNRGSLLETRLGYIYQQNPSLDLSDAEGKPLGLDSMGFGFGNYYRAHADFTHYSRLAQRWTLASTLKSYNNISFDQNLIDNYQIGGLQRTFRNQITFVGLDAADVTTSSYSGLDMDFQFQMLRRGILHTRASLGTYGYLGADNSVDFDNSLAGLALELQYNTLFGPVHLAATYSTLTEKLGYTIYLGMLF